ncbi:hypothetical protein [Agathobacter sp.]
MFDLHQVILCGYMLLTFRLAAVDNTEYQKTDAHEKWHKLDYEVVSRV